MAAWSEQARRRHVPCRTRSHGELVRIIVTTLLDRVLTDFESFGRPSVTLDPNAEPMPYH
ncbi:hypothetical protein ACIQUQ_30170 [Streptomyces sp. NPDC101118]|uniref:hypothetical protein n=1 Tax=Streptomyces sp. NPDC101118 TaxID=3366109 RepID=UPI00382BFC69